MEIFYVMCGGEKLRNFIIIIIIIILFFLSVKIKYHLGSLSFLFSEPSSSSPCAVSFAFFLLKLSSASSPPSPHCSILTFSFKLTKLTLPSSLLPPLLSFLFRSLPAVAIDAVSELQSVLCV